jgi:hypothetical protein
MRRRFWRPAAAFAAAMLASGVATGCGGKSQPAANTTPSAAAPAPSATGTPCGTIRTAAGVPVQIEVQQGSVSCHAALQIERAYTRAIASGKVAGNGGGAPVTIHGWVCQGYSTPQVLQTGRASACRKSGSEILAVLPTPGLATPSS